MSMLRSNPKQRWFSTWRTKPRSAAFDAADMGTAFGLDFSMDNTEPAKAVTKKKRSGWMARLGFGRKTAF